MFITKDKLLEELLKIFRESDYSNEKLFPSLSSAKHKANNLENFFILKLMFFVPFYDIFYIKMGHYRTFLKDYHKIVNILWKSTCFFMYF